MDETTGRPVTPERVTALSKALHDGPLVKSACWLGEWSAHKSWNTISDSIQRNTTGLC